MIMIYFLRSMGPPTDSIFEYFLKSYIETGLPDTLGLQMYYDSINAFFDNGLIQTSSPSNLEYNSEMVNGTADPVVHHLTCFAGIKIVLQDTYFQIFYACKKC